MNAVRLLRSPWADYFDEIIALTKRSLLICSPYVGAGPCRRIEDAAKRRPLRDFLVLTDLSCHNMLSGATDVSALLSLLDIVPSVRIRFLPSLHAKVYIADNQTAVVTSSNLTDSGLCRNFEYGACFSDARIVRRIRQDALDYAALGSPVDRGQLQSFAKTVAQLRDLHSALTRGARTRLKREFNRLLGQAETDILRTRAGGRSPNQIFADAILYILRSGAADTNAIHRRVQQIHPDLCDDSQERVIDGLRFGKKWKHAVRSAQQYLKRHGRISLLKGKWRLES